MYTERSNAFSNSVFHRLVLSVEPDPFCYQLSSFPLSPNIPTFLALIMPLLPPLLNYEQARAVVDANFIDIRFQDLALGGGHWGQEGQIVHRSQEASC